MEICSYIGRTQRRLGDRIREHVPKWYLDGKKNKSGNSSITRHLIECATPTQNPREAFKILRKLETTKELKIMEALHINREKPVLCSQKDYVMVIALDF